MGAKNCPLSFLVDRYGKIVYEKSGFGPGDELILEKEIKKLIESDKAINDSIPNDTLINVEEPIRLQTKPLKKNPDIFIEEEN